jgi:hypothetical protein
MNGRCGKCGVPLGTGDFGNLCSSCKRELNEASYRTYENGYVDGFRDGQKSMKDIYEETVRLTQTNAPRYLIVTQEKYDEIIKGEIK